MDFAAQFDIGGRAVGPGQPCYVIAEAGSNHNGDLGLARQLIDLAADAACDAVKFQVFRPEDLLSPTGPKADYLDPLLDDTTSLYDLFATTAIDRTWLPELARHCEARKIHFLATPFDVGAVDALTAPEVAVPAIKNASSELWHLPLLQRAAATGLPLIVSTGMATMGDIEDALAAIHAGGGRQVSLLQCTVAYPVPADAVNLRAMDTLRQAFGVPVGFSDHTTGIWAPIAAAARGADIIEKHVTVSRDLPGPDHPFAIEGAELAEMMTGIRSAEAALGDGRKVRHVREEEIYRIGVRNLVATRDLAVGDIIDDNAVAVLRGPLGIAPKLHHAVIGRRTGRAVDAGNTLQWNDLA